MLVRTKVNGEWRETDVWPGSSLLFMLREHLGLPGSKNACEQGECGCTGYQKILDAVRLAAERGLGDEA